MTSEKKLEYDYNPTPIVAAPTLPPPYPQQQGGQQTVIIQPVLNQAVFLQKGPSHVTW